MARAGITGWVGVIGMPRAVGPKMRRHLMLRRKVREGMFF
jgi:hypothetical protein